MLTLTTTKLQGIDPSSRFVRKSPVPIAAETLHVEVDSFLATFTIEHQEGGPFARSEPLLKMVDLADE